MASRLYGRLAAERVIDPETGEVLIERDEMIDHDRARRLMFLALNRYFGSLANDLRTDARRVCATAMAWTLAVAQL